MKHVGAVAIALGMALGPGGLAAQSYQTTTQARRLEGSGPLAVNVEYGAGRLHIAPGEAKQLYRVSLTYDEDQFEPTIEYRASERALDVRLSGTAHVSHQERGQSRQRLDLSLSPATPVDLALKFGAADAELELGGLSMRRAHIETGASQTTVSFREPNQIACDDLSFNVGAAEFEVEKLGNSRCSTTTLEGGVGRVVLDLTGDWGKGQDAHVSATIGLGALELRIPKGLGVRLEVSRFLASVDRAGFEKRGSAYFTPDFDSAPSKVTIDVNATFGSVAVTWVH